MSGLDRIRCWWKHAWEFRGGHWIIPKVGALTKRQCTRCGLYQEIIQDHLFGVNVLEKEEMRCLEKA